MNTDITHCILAQLLINSGKSSNTDYVKTCVFVNVDFNKNSL